MNKNHERTQRKIWTSIVAIALLFTMLVVTSYALLFSMISEEDNLFETGYVKIDLNHGMPVFERSEWRMEPGASIKRDFTIYNYSSVPVYYRVFLENIEGSLQEVTTFSLYDGDTLLFTVRTKDFDTEQPFIADEILEVEQDRTLSAVITMDEDASNAYQSGELTFDMTAQATQVAHNPNKEFE